MAYSSLYDSKREELRCLKGQLEQERQSFIPQWQELGDYILPRRTRINKNDVNKGDRRNQKIIDSTASSSARSLRAGLMGGVTSPARVWFRLSTENKQKNELDSVKEWLQTVTDNMSAIFLRSNLYTELQTVYGDLGVFGTGAMLIDEDDEDVIRCYSYPVGSFMLANSEKMRVDTFIREFQLTVRQLIGKFGKFDSKGKVKNWENFSEKVKEYWDTDKKETWIDVVHCIMPNEDHDDEKIESKYKRFASYYYEEGNEIPAAGDRTKDLFLRESGYDHFPVLAPRWETTGEDVYGTECPGMTSLGEIKQIQMVEKRLLQAYEKSISPPMQAPNSLRNQVVAAIPNGITYVDTLQGQQGLRPLYEVNPRTGEMEQKQEQCRQRIKTIFYEDLFFAIQQLERQVTATEVNERKDEKLLALGPVLEHLNQDLLDPLIDIVFDYMLKQNLVPTPPQELSGQPIKVEYISILASAQKAANIGSVERVTQFVGQVAQFKPEVLDKIDGDQLVDIYGDITSVPFGIIRSDDVVAQLRGQRAQAQAAQQKQAMVAQAAQTAQTLSQTPTQAGGSSALDDLIAQGQAGNLFG